MKGYSTYPKGPAFLEPHHQIVECYIQDTHWRGSYPSAEKQSVYSTAPVNWASCCGVVLMYTTLFAPSSITALIIPVTVSLCHNLVRLPPISLLQRGKKTDQKFLPGKVTMHSPAPRCDSLKVRPMALSERKRGYWQLKTGLQRGTYIAEQQKKIITPISAVDKKRVYITSRLQMSTKNLRVWHLVV